MGGIFSYFFTEEENATTETASIQTQNVTQNEQQIAEHNEPKSGDSEENTEADSNIILEEPVQGPISIREFDALMKAETLNEPIFEKTISAEDSSLVNQSKPMENTVHLGNISKEQPVELEIEAVSTIDNESPVKIDKKVSSYAVSFIESNKSNFEEPEIVKESNVTYSSSDSLQKTEESAYVTDNQEIVSIELNVTKVEDSEIEFKNLASKYTSFNQVKNDETDSKDEQKELNSPELDIFVKLNELPTIIENSNKLDVASIGLENNATFELNDTHFSEEKLVKESVIIDTVIEPNSEKKINIENISLSVEEITGQDLSKPVIKDQIVSESDLTSSDKLIKETLVLEDSKTIELNEAAIFEKLMEQELNVRINILKSIEAVIADHVNKKNKATDDPKMKDEPVKNDAFIAASQSENQIQPSVVDVHTHETIYPENIDTGENKETVTENNSIIEVKAKIDNEIVPETELEQKLSASVNGEVIDNTDKSLILISEMKLTDEEEIVKESAITVDSSISTEECRLNQVKVTEESVNVVDYQEIVSIELNEGKVEDSTIEFKKIASQSTSFNQVKNDEPKELNSSELDILVQANEESTELNEITITHTAIEDELKIDDSSFVLENITAVESKIKEFVNPVTTAVIKLGSLEDQKVSIIEEPVIEMISNYSEIDEESNKPREEETVRKISMKCDESLSSELGEESIFQESLLIINSIISKISEDSKKEEIEVNSSNTNNVLEKKANEKGVMFDNILPGDLDKKMGSESMAAENPVITAKSNFNAELSSNAQAEIEPKQDSEVQVNFENTSLKVTDDEKQIELNKSNVENSAKEFELANVSTNSKLNEAAIFEKLMEQELNVRINILKSIEAVIADHVNKKNKATDDPKMKDEPVKNDAFIAASQSENQIQPSVVDVHTHETIYPENIDTGENKETVTENKETVTENNSIIEVKAKIDNEIVPETELEQKLSASVNGEVIDNTDKSLILISDINLTDSSLNLINKTSINIEQSKASLEIKKQKQKEIKSKESEDGCLIS